MAQPARGPAGALRPREGGVDHMLEIAASVLEWVKRPDRAPAITGGPPEENAARAAERRQLLIRLHEAVRSHEFSTDPRVDTPEAERRLVWDSHPDAVRSELLAEVLWREPALAGEALRWLPRPPVFVRETAEAIVAALTERPTLADLWRPRRLIAKASSASQDRRTRLLEVLREHGAMPAGTADRPGSIAADDLYTPLVVSPELLRRAAEILHVAVPFTMVLDRELRDIEASRLRRRDVNKRSRIGVLYRFWARALEDRDKLLQFTGTAPAATNGATGVQQNTSVRRAALLRSALEAAWNVFRHAPFSATGDVRPPADPDPVVPRHRLSLRRAFEHDLFGLALSGGGIRSATFGLGVLQALSTLDLLRRVDYLSTVSGGGYVGSWLTAWIRREDDGVHRVQRLLSPVRTTDPEAADVRPIRFLREHSNYLAPRPGFFSADTWTLVAIWLRNTVLNQLVLIVAIALALLVPRLVGLMSSGILERGTTGSPLRGLGAALFVLACVVIAFEQRKFTTRGATGATPRDYAFLQRVVIVPGFMSAWILSLTVWVTVWNERTAGGGAAATGIAAGVLFTLAILLIQWVGEYVPSIYGAERRRWRLHVVRVALLLAAIGAGAAGGALVALVVWVFGRAWLPDAAGGGAGVHDAAWHVITFGPPLLMSAFGLAVMLHIGLLGRAFNDDRREWWARLGAWLMIYCIAWLACFVVAIYAPQWIAYGIARLHVLATSGIGAAWVVSTVSGVLAARSQRTAPTADRGGAGGRRWLDVVARVTPYVFVAGILVFVSFGLHLALARASAVSPTCPGDPNAGWLAALACAHGAVLRASAGAPVFGALAILAFVVAVLGRRVDVNEFSMHHFYKNRLVRCYLGASRERAGCRREPHPFTGFDYRDEVRMQSLSPTNPYWPRELRDETAAAPECPPASQPPRYVGPYQIVNAALNLVTGSDLAWQERKAQSFVFTPAYSGYDYGGRASSAATDLVAHGYRPTREYAYPGEGVNLGTALAISGAAASPNMGYHSSPAAAFLMTMFDVRLGWWVGNPRHRVKWREPSPRFGLMSLLYDLFGLTNDETGFVNLSDGGHFENLGIYELVRRRCRYIVACDAEQDPGFTFSGLGNAIRKCRTDFGVEIEIATDRMRQAEGVSSTHCVVGDILYPGGERGVLVYLKASLTGDEPGDVLEYARRAREFPHQTTGDQFFDESQFESYRRLGYHVAFGAFSRAVEELEELALPWNPIDSDDAEVRRLLEQAAIDGLIADETGLSERNYRRELFRTMKSIWYPPDASVQRHFVRHAERYGALLERLHDQPWLRGIEQVFHPGADPAFVEALGRDRFYVYVAMIGLMQNVYIELDLESGASHPHNAGWIRLFRQWASDEGFRLAWNATRRTFGERFRRFCATKLGLLD